MATLNWPAGSAFQPRALSFGARVPRSGWAGFFTGQVQRLSHLADRMRCTMTLPPCDALLGQQREAFFTGLVSTGDWVRLGHLHRLVPAGTLRGTPTVQATALAGARQLVVQTVPGATLVGGDVLGLNGQLLMVGHAGAVANGSGHATVPLVLPLLSDAGPGEGVLWQQPTGTFQLLQDEISFGYGRGSWQGALELVFGQVA